MKKRRGLCDRCGKAATHRLEAIGTMGKGKLVKEQREYCDPCYDLLYKPQVCGMRKPAGPSKRS